MRWLIEAELVKHVGVSLQEDTPFLLYSMLKLTDGHTHEYNDRKERNDSGSNVIVLTVIHTIISSS